LSAAGEGDTVLPQQKILEYVEQSTASSLVSLELERETLERERERERGRGRETRSYVLGRMAIPCGNVPGYVVT
jgi:hypothetical protein